MVVANMSGSVPCTRVERGLTLVELQIALALSVLLMAMLYSGLDVGVRAQKSIALSATRNSDARVLNNFVRETLENIAPLVSNSRELPESLFRGEKYSMHFGGLLPLHRGSSGHYLIELKLTKSNAEQSMQLKLRYCLLSAKYLVHGAFSVCESDANEMVLAEKLSLNTRFEYFGKTAAADSWETRWEGSNLPALIRITSTSRDDSRWTYAVKTRINRAQQHLVLTPTSDAD